MDNKKQCWECIRRRWVCDSTRPICKKCRNAGLVCPGYGEEKPLHFLAPGVVLSRPRKVKSARSQATCGISTVPISVDSKRSSSTDREGRELDMVLQNDTLIPTRSGPEIELFKSRTDVDDVVQAITYCQYSELSFQ